MLRGMSSLVLMHLWITTLPHMVFLVLAICGMIVRVVAAVSRKRKMNMTLQQWYVFLKPMLLTKLLIILLFVKHLWEWQTEHFELGTVAISSEM